MRRIHKIFILALSITLMLFYETEVSAETYVGVKVGNWVKYSDICIWGSTNPEVIEPSYIKDIKNTKWRILTVQAISGTNVTISVTRYFENDTQRIDTYSVDVATGKGDPEIGFQILPAGLGEGDAIFQSGLRINYTASKEFAGVKREVNYAGLTISIEGVTVLEYYWDKTTGILCSSVMFDTVFPQGFETTTLIQTKMIETNIWDVENESQPTEIEWWQTVVVAIIISAIIISAVLMFIKKKRKSKRRNK